MHYLFTVENMTKFVLRDNYLEFPFLQNEFSIKNIYISWIVNKLIKIDKISILRKEVIFWGENKRRLEINMQLILDDSGYF